MTSEGIWNDLCDELTALVHGPYRGARTAHEVKQKLKSLAETYGPQLGYEQHRFSHLLFGLYPAVIPDERRYVTNPPNGFERGEYGLREIYERLASTVFTTAPNTAGKKIVRRIDWPNSDTVKWLELLKTYYESHLNGTVSRRAAHRVGELIARVKLNVPIYRWEIMPPGF